MLDWKMLVRETQSFGDLIYAYTVNMHKIGAVLFCGLQKSEYTKTYKTHIEPRVGFVPRQYVVHIFARGASEGVVAYLSRESRRRFKTH